MTAGVVVVGSLNVDLVVRVDRLPREGETLTGASLDRTPGGKGLNQAVAARRAGAAVRMVGAVGDDDHGRWLLDVLDREGVERTGVALAAAPTGVALITVSAAGANTIVVAPGANHARPPTAGELPAGAGDVVVAQAEVPEGEVLLAFAAARRAGARTVLNQAPFRPVADDLWAATDLVVVNETELEGLVGAGTPPPVELGARVGWARDEVGSLLARRPGPAGVVVTLGEAGAVLHGPHGEASVPAPRVEAVDTVGAGDCLAGYLAAGLADGLPAEAALARAVRAAAVAVQRPGAALAAPYAHELPPGD